MTPQIIAEASYGTSPAGPFSWTKIHDTNLASTRLRSCSWERGLDDLIIGKTETGTGNLLLNNSDRSWDPQNTASPLYPNIVPNLPVRVRAVVGGSSYGCFQHFLGGFPRRRRGPNYAEIDIRTVDGMAGMALAPIAPATYASLTVSVPGLNTGLLYTALNPGIAEEDITISYGGHTDSPLQISVSGKAINVRYHRGLTGVPVANDVLSAINSDAAASKLVRVTLASGSNGTGQITSDYPKTALSGGSATPFPLELTGARITRCANLANWPAASRTISAGTVYVSSMPLGTTPDNLLSHVLDIAGEAGEFGLVFVDGSGNLVFKDHTALYVTGQGSVSATLSDQVSGFSTYTDSETDYDREHVWNEWSGSIDGGISITLQNTASIAQNWRNVHTVSSWRTSETELQGSLEFGLAEYGTPAQRLQSLTIRPGSDDALWAKCLGLELGSRVRVIEHPVGGGSAIDRNYFITRLSGSINVGPTTTATFVYRLWPVRISNYFIFNDGTYGNLNTTVLV